MHWVRFTAREPDRWGHYPGEVPRDKALRRQTGCLYVGKPANMIQQLQFYSSGFLRLQLSSLDVDQYNAGFRKSKVHVRQLLKRNQQQAAHKEHHETEAHLRRQQGSKYSDFARLFATCCLQYLVR